jgi:DnaA family protein
MQQLVLEMPPATPPRLEDFIPGRNREILETLGHWLKGQGQAFVFIWGEPGSGKSLLMEILARELGEQCQWVQAKSDSTPNFGQQPWLLVDDVEALSPAGCEALFNQYNRLRDQGGRLLASASCPPGELKLLPDLVTRFSWGLVLRLNPLNDEEKMAALQSRAQQWGVELSQEAARYILSRWDRNMNSLFAFIQELNRRSLSTHRPMTIPLIRDALQAYNRPSGN